RLQLASPLATQATMCPIAAAQHWACPPICSAGELAEFLGVSNPELDWFADRQNRIVNTRRERLTHYRYRILSKRFGQIRLIESPKPRLKAIQRRILAAILDCVPPHSSAHGFRRQH